MRRIYSQMIIIMFLFLCSPAHDVRAEELPQEDVQWESVSTWEELQVWLLEHESSGGNIKFTQDIAMTGEFVYSRFFSGMTEPGQVCMDTGAYHLLVEGDLQFAGCPKFTITGDGEIFRVAKAGRLKTTAIIIENRAGGCAIYQEEGGTLCVGGGTTVQGEIHYAELPVATAYPYVEVMVPKAGDLTECLPSTIYTYYNYQGCDSSSEMSVEWDLESFQSQIADRQRLCLSGQIVGASQLIPPTAEVVFFDRDITFSQVMFYEYKTSTLVSFDYYCRGELKPQLYYSYDQETYTPISSYPYRVEEGKGQARIALLKGEDPSACAEDEILWELGDPAISFVFGWQTEAGEKYSDVICYDGTGGVIAGEPYDGNRGGGTDLGDGSSENGTPPLSPTPSVPEEENPVKEEQPGKDPLQPPTTITVPPVSVPQETTDTEVLSRKPKTKSLVLAGAVGIFPEEITENSEQIESTAQEETSDTTSVPQTVIEPASTSVSDSKAVAQEDADQGDTEQSGSKLWLVILITVIVLLAAFGLSGVILKKLHKS